MFGELSKLFDRNFVIGYFLPVALFATVTFALLAGFGLLPSSTDVLSYFSALNTEASAPENTAIGTLAPLVNTTIFALVLWLVAVFLLAINRTVYRLMEGYGPVNPARLFAWRERRRYRKLQNRKEKLASDSKEKLRLLREEAVQFPPREGQLLPTRFGNTLRAFEYYSWWIYGIDAIAGWNRVVAVIPKDYQDLISEAKAQTDFWLHLWVFGLLILIENIIGIVYVAIFPGTVEHLYMLWVSPLVLLFPLGASRGARRAAVAWGDTVKASFDVFLPELGKKLGFPPISTRKQERDLWWLFSNVITRRDLDARTEFVEKLLAGTDRTAMVREGDELRSQLESRTPEIEPPREPPGASEMTMAVPDSTEPQAPFEDAQEPAQEEPRSWWRRKFGG